MHRRVGKQLLRHALCLVLGLCFALGFLGANTRPAIAAPKVGDIWYVGDEIDIKGYWFVDSDTDDLSKLVFWHCSDKGTLPEASGYMSGFGQWYFSNVLPKDASISSGSQETESGKASLNVAGSQDKAPYGVRIKSGDGSEQNPFVFEGFYKKPPMAKDLIFKDSEQELVTAGDAGEGWEIMYSLGPDERQEGPYDTTLPKGKDAGPYYVWYFIRPCNDEQHLYVPVCITVTIKKADSSVDTAPQALELHYSGEAQNLVSAGSATGGTLQYSLDGTSYSETIPQGTAAGEYTVYYKVVGDKNHNDTEAQTVSVTIEKVPSSVSKAPVAAKGLKEDGSAHELVTAGTAEGGELQYSLDGETYSSDIPTATAEGEYTVYYKVVADKNHTDTEAQTLKVTVAAKDPTTDPDDEPATKATLTFDANGGKGSMDPVTIDAGSTLTVPTNKFTRAGYIFAGWNTQKDGKGSSFKNGAKIKLNRDATFYAQWTKKSSSGTSTSKKTKATKPSASTATKASKSSTLPKTGDPFSLATAAMLAGAGTSAIFFGLRKRK